jgi:hypothetical protein
MRAECATVSTQRAIVHTPVRSLDSICPARSLGISVGGAGNNRHNQGVANVVVAPECNEVLAQEATAGPSHPTAAGLNNPTEGDDPGDW